MIAYPVLKRAGDLVVATTALVALSPVLLAVAALVRWRLGAPVLFRQRRPGRGGRAFELVKFRTMRTGPGSDDARLTPFGRALRATSLDELPELWNVVRGDMSLIGPRPLLTEYLELYSPEQRRRHDVRPGLTGWAQVNGRNALDWPQRLALDVEYVDSLSARLDARILWRSVSVVLSGRGVSADDRATVAPFRGETGAA